MMRPSRPAVLLLVLSSLALAAPSEVDPVAARLRALSRTAVEQAGSPRGAASLDAMFELRDDLEDLAPLAQAYTSVIQKRGAHPSVRALARTYLLDVERARGKTAAAAQLTRELGYLTDFHVLGGFENEGKSGCDVEPFAPAKLDLTATYPIQGREVHWQKLPVRSPTGFVDLASAIRPSNEVVAYAATVLEASQENRTTLSLGTSGGYRLYVNGQLAARSDRYNSARPEQSRVSVRLARGANQVLLKVCQISGSLGFFLRAEPDRGVVTASAPETLPAPAKLSPQAQLLPSLAEQLAAEVKKNPKDAALRGDYARVLAITRAYESREHTATAEAERAALQAPQDVELQRLAARLQTDDHNLRRRHLEAAIAASPSDPFARLELAQLELSRDHADRALGLLQSLVRDYPRFAEARITLSRAHEELNEFTTSVAVVDQALRDLPRSPMVIRSAIRMSRRLDRPQEAIERLRVAIALRNDDLGSRRQLAAIFADLGRIEDAVRELAQVVALEPYSNGDRLQLAELLASNGRVDEAEQLFAIAQQLSPAEPDVHEREARALLHGGRKEEAVVAFERALALRPQNPALKEVLRSLKGETASYGTQYLVDLAPLSKTADEFAGEDAVYLVDGTYVRVQPTGLSSRLHQLAVKVYTDRGVNAFRSFPITYSPNRQEVRVLRARVTKPDGSVIDSHGDADRNINEPWSGMYYDARARVLSFPALAAGDVLEIQYRLEDTAAENLLSDYWGDVDYVQNTAPKVHYQYLVDMPSSRPLYWNKSRSNAGVQHAVEPLEGGRTLYRWAAKNVSKIVPEPMMPGWAEVATTLHVSTYQTWEQVGRYYWGLVRDQLTPNDELRRTTDEVLRNVDRRDQQAVVRAIYNFVVSNTRYVALEFGIHGYKPYRVDRVLARRFGDCKDKASLIHSMLQVAGVDSRLVLLRMRNLGALDAEPASLAAFNHAIVYVPQFDLYLDGTAEFHNARELPSADRVANVLIVEPGKASPFLTTPEAKADDNVTRRTMNVALRTDGTAELLGQTAVVGTQAPQYRRVFKAESTRRSLLEQQWGKSFPGLTISDVTVSDLSLLDSDVTLGFKMAVPRYSEVGRDLLRFHPFGTGREFTQSLAPLAERQYDLVVDGPWAEKHQFVYTLPAGYDVPELPAAIRDETSFGRLVLECKKADGKLVCDSEFALTAARVPAKDYPAFRAFLGRVDQAFSRKLVAVKTGAQTATR